ncbi:MAG: M28 family peptidase [Verrucomicrobiae bacterium]|nr:M28 family peptidase [Verrucomicrobiae bacterium]
MRAAPYRIVGLIVLVSLVVYAGGRYMSDCGPPPVRQVEPLATGMPDRLREHVVMLADRIGPRHVFAPRTLQAAADYIESQWQQQGYRVTRHTYEVAGVPCHNLEINLTGQTRALDVVLIGAHYDSIPESPGANDNGSGVAVLLELSRWAAAESSGWKRTVRFVAFVNEEPPWFQTEQMGSRVYARACREAGQNIVAMLSLETMGYFSDQPGSQQFPNPLFYLFYPRRGNFIGLVSNFTSRPLLQSVSRAFRSATELPVECCATFAAIPGVDWSDHGSFWREGYRAIMVTDTAPYRYPHYHRMSDTPDKIDYVKLAEVMRGLQRVIRTLANE